MNCLGHGNINKKKKRKMEVIETKWMFQIFITMKTITSCYYKPGTMFIIYYYKDFPVTTIG